MIFIQKYYDVKYHIFAASSVYALSQRAIEFLKKLLKFLCTVKRGGTGKNGVKNLNDKYCRLAVKDMALVLDGNSEIGAHERSNLCYLIC